MDTEKWGRGKARERYGDKGMKKFADGGRAPQIATRSAELEDYIASNPEPNSLSAGKGKSFDSPSSRYERLGPGLAEDARNSAAERTKSPKGGQLGWKSGGKVQKKADGGEVPLPKGRPGSLKLRDDIENIVQDSKSDLDNQVRMGAEVKQNQGESGARAASRGRLSNDPFTAFRHRKSGGKVK